ncbi:MAG: hypothetical protein J6B16_05250 [Clostridia bacterium]|nr:hypothetical protein [Clostridia bacterium]
MKFTSKIKVLVLCLLLALSSFAFVGCKTIVDDPTVVPGPSLGVNEYEDESQAPKYNKYGNITVDGIVNDDEWAGQKKFTISPEIGGIRHEIEASSIFTDAGVVIYWKVLGAACYYNAGQSLHDNSGVEMYIASGDATVALNNSYEIPLSAQGLYGSSKYLKTGGGTSEGYKNYSIELDFQAQVDGEINDPSNNGFMIEVMVPWFLLGATNNNRPDYVCIDGAIINRTSAVGPRNAWYSLAREHRVGYAWTGPQSWYKFSNAGWEDDTIYEGIFKVNKFTKGINVVDNGKEVSIDKGWNTGMAYADLVETVTGDFYQEVTIFRPSLYVPEFITQENQVYADGTIDAGLGGLSVRRLGSSNDLQFAGHIENKLGEDKKWRVRFQGASWAGYTFSADELAKFSDINQGIRIGMLNIGTMIYAYIENADGVMTKFSEYNMTGRDANFKADSQKLVGLSTLVGCIFKDYQIYSGDDMATIPYLINGGEALEGGSVVVNGTIGGGATVEVYPDAGKEVKSLTINGEKINSVFYDVPAFSTPKLNIEVEFEDSTVEKSSVTLAVKAGALGATAETAKDARITFSGDYGAMGKVEDGSVTVLLADGNYSVSIPNCFPVTITVADGVASISELVFVESIFDLSNSTWNVGYDANGYVISSTIHDKYGENTLTFTDLDFAGKDKYGFAFNYTFTGSLSSNSKYFPTFEVYLEDGTKASMQMCCWGTNALLKYFNDGSTSSAFVSGAGNFSVDLSMVFSGSTVSLYKRAGTTLFPIREFIELGSKIVDVRFSYCNDYNGAGTPEEWSFSNISINNLAPIDATAEPCDNADVTLSSDKISVGQKLAITVVPKQSSNDQIITVKSIKVNGVEVDFTVEGNKIVASYVLKDREASSVNVVVETKQASLVSINATVKTGYAVTGATTSVVADGTVVKFDGLTTVEATVTDGKVAVELTEGSYVVTMDGAMASTLIVTDAGIAEIILPLPLINLEDTMAGGDSSPKADRLVTGYSNELGYYITNSANGNQYQSFNNVFSYANGAKITLTFTVKGSTGTAQLYPAIMVSGLDGDGVLTRTEMQFCIWNGAFSVKQGKFNNQSVGMGMSGDFSETYTIYVKLNGGKVDVVLEKDGNTIATTNYANTSDKANSNWKYLTSITEIGIGFMNGTQGDTTWMFSNIDISPLA